MTNTGTDARAIESELSKNSKENDITKAGVVIYFLIYGILHATICIKYIHILLSMIKLGLKLKINKNVSKNGWQSESSEEGILRWEVGGSKESSSKVKSVCTVYYYDRQMQTIITVIVF